VLAFHKVLAFRMVLTHDKHPFVVDTALQAVVDLQPHEKLVVQLSIHPFA
jgi:hypothetical protein